MLDEEIKQWLQVDEDSPSGLSWITKKPNTATYAGKPALAGVSNKGYWVGTFSGRHMKAHRVVFFLKTGEWPEQVDHLNGNRLDNRGVNLRAATNSTNQHNIKNATGVWVEVVKGYKRYRAKIVANGKRIYLGSFRTEEEACAAYLAAKKIHHPTSPINKET